MIAMPSQFEESLLQLAPTSLENRRLKRYHGDTLSLPITQLSELDRVRVRRIYAILLQFLEGLEGGAATARAAWLESYLRGQHEEELVALAHDLGRETMAANPSDELAEALHDLRGGGLTPLIGLLQITARRLARQETADDLYYLARDHLKIMRNILIGLDDERRALDLELKVHTTELMVEKWHKRVLCEHGFRARVEVECGQVVAIGECCIEFGALDRICYNLANNACRHAANGLVQVVLFPVPEADGADLRFVFLNRVSREDRDRLASDDLCELFEAHHSTTGSGFGLAIVSEFVRCAYGLSSSREAVRLGHVGAALMGDSFAAWFHWPRVLPR